jgi:hypothetical protein
MFYTVYFNNCFICKFYFFLLSVFQKISFRRANARQTFKKLAEEPL